MRFSTMLEITDTTASITLSGYLDVDAVPDLEMKLKKLNSQCAKKRLVLLTKDLVQITAPVLRLLIFTKQKLGPHVELYAIGANSDFTNILKDTGFYHSVIFRDADADGGL